MGRVIKMPIPVDAMVEFTCPDKHNLGWRFLGTQTSPWGTFAQLECRKCGFKMAGEMCWAFEISDDELPEG